MLFAPVGPTVSAMRVEILPFAAEHVPAAAGLLAERHRRHRRTSPLLSPRFEDPVACEAEVAAAVKIDAASGAVVVRQGRVVGFLHAAPKPAATWGPNAWVESAGHALADGEDPEVLRELYAVAAQRWADEGRAAHYVLVPAADRALVDAWFRLGFGHQHTHALTANLHRPPRIAAGLTIRRAEHDDIPALARDDVELDRHQRLAPVFAAVAPATFEDAAEEWREDWDDPDFHTWVAVHEGRVVGHAVGCSIEKSSGNAGLVRPDRAGFLGFAAVLPEARGLGAGRALGETVMHWSGEAGYDCVVTDWRETNLLSSRSWKALGFVPAFLRLHRLIGH